MNRIPVIQNLFEMPDLPIYEIFRRPCSIVAKSPLPRDSLKLIRHHPRGGRVVWVELYVNLSLIVECVSKTRKSVLGLAYTPHRSHSYINTGILCQTFKKFNFNYKNIDEWWKNGYSWKKEEIQIILNNKINKYPINFWSIDLLQAQWPPRKWWSKNLSLQLKWISLSLFLLQ